MSVRLHPQPWSYPSSLVQPSRSSSSDESSEPCWTPASAMLAPLKAAQGTTSAGVIATSKAPPAAATLVSLKVILGAAATGFISSFVSTILPVPPVEPPTSPRACSCPAAGIAIGGCLAWGGPTNSGIGGASGRGAAGCKPALPTAAPAGHPTKWGKAGTAPHPLACLGFANAAASHSPVCAAQVLGVDPSP